MNETDMLNSAERAQRRKNRLQLTAILLIVLIPVLGSTFMFYTGIGIPKGANNNGLLIEPPIDLTDIQLTTLSGDHWSWGDSGKFRLALLVDGECDAECAKLLHNMRQVHVRLAKRSTSLERWLVQVDYSVTKMMMPDANENIADTFPQLTILRGEKLQWRNKLAGNTVINQSFTGQQLLLLDRRGYLIMVFNSSQSGQEMLDDVQFLIKSTQ